jgi:Cu+-exporting ATPase
MPAEEAAAPGEATAVDPVCGMTVTVKNARAAGRTLTRAGVTYYFCSDHCKKAFEKP